MKPVDWKRILKIIFWTCGVFVGAIVGIFLFSFVFLFIYYSFNHVGVPGIHIPLDFVLSFFSGSIPLDNFILMIQDAYRGVVTPACVGFNCPSVLN